MTYHNPHRRRILGIAAAVLATVVCTVTACGSNQGSASVNSVADSMVVRTTADPGCLDPRQFSLRVALQWGRQLVDSLVYENTAGKFSPWLAKSWTINSNATVFTFVLRNDVKFSDGSALDAQVVKDNFDEMYKLGATAAVAASYLTNFKDAEVVNKYTVRISFTKPNASFMYAVSTPNLGILSDASLSHTAGQLCAGKFSGSGPFTLSDYVPNEKFVLTRNDNYEWGPAGLANTGPAYLKTVTFDVVTNNTTADDAALDGDFDMLWTPQNSDIKSLEAAGWQQVSSPGPALSSSWLFNWNKKSLVTTDTAVRQAMMIGVDRTALAATDPLVYSPATGIFDSSHPYYQDESAALAYDPAKAIKILEADGWTKVGSNGIRERDGQPLVVNAMMYSTDGSANVMAVAQQELAQIGIELKLTPVTNDQENAIRAAGDWETRTSWFTGPEPEDITGAMDGPNATIQKYMLEQSAIPTFAARAKVVEQLTNYLIKNAIIIPLWQQNENPFWSSKVQGMTMDVGGLVMFSQLKLAQ